MPYQFRQTGAEIQDILDQVGTNTGDITTINGKLSQMIKSVTIADTTLTSSSYFLDTTLPINTTAPINFYCTSGRHGWFYQFMENISNNGYWAVAPLTKDNGRPNNLVFGGVLYYIDFSVL